MSQLQESRKRAARTHWKACPLEALHLCTSLPQPRLCFRFNPFVCLFVCLCEQDYTDTTKRISMKLIARMGHGPGKNQSNYIADLGKWAHPWKKIYFLEHCQIEHFFSMSQVITQGSRWQKSGIFRRPICMNVCNLVWLIEFKGDVGWRFELYWGWLSFSQYIASSVRWEQSCHLNYNRQNSFSKPETEHLLVDQMKLVIYGY